MISVDPIQSLLGPLYHALYFYPSYVVQHLGPISFIFLCNDHVPAIIITKTTVTSYEMLSSRLSILQSIVQWGALGKTKFF